MKALICSIALLVSASPALAQETGTLVTREAAQMDLRTTAGVRQTMLQFGRCIVSREPGRVERLIGMAADRPEYNRTQLALYGTLDECISGGQLSFSSTLFQGSLFEALYARDFRSDTPPDFSKVTDTGYAGLYTVPMSGVGRKAVALEGFGECVARADPMSTRKLVLSVPGSGSENDALTVLALRFNACVPKGEVIKLSKSIVRGAVAEGLYRLSRAAAGLPTVPAR